MNQLIQSEFWLGGSAPSWKSSWAWVFTVVWSRFCSICDHYGALDEGPATTQDMLFLGARQKPREASLPHKPFLSFCLCHLCLYSIGQSQVIWPISTSGGRVVYSLHSGRRKGIHLLNDNPNHDILQAHSCLRAFWLAVLLELNAVRLDLCEPASPYSVFNLHAIPLERTLKADGLG